MASAHGYLGFASWLQADFERAAEECTVALRMFRELGDVEGIAWSLLSLGTVARHQGAGEQAAALLQESRSLAERIGFREGIAWSLDHQNLLYPSLALTLSKEGANIDCIFRPPRPATT